MNLLLFPFALVWTLAVSAFIVIACASAQLLSLASSVFIFTFTLRWETQNLCAEVALPRLAALWHDFERAISPNGMSSEAA